MWPIPPYRHAMPPPQSDAIGTSRTACTTPAMSRSRRISPVSVTTPASSPGCAPSPTTSCVAIRLQRSIRIAMPPLSAASTHSSSGASVKSVEQPWMMSTRRKTARRNSRAQSPAIGGRSPWACPPGSFGSNSAAVPPITSSAPLNQIVTPRPAFPATQPLTVVPTMNAAEPDARSHPYSNRCLPSDSLSCAAVVASASDRGATGANIAAWSSPTASKLPRPCIIRYPDPATDAATAQPHRIDVCRCRRSAQ